MPFRAYGKVLLGLTWPANEMGLNFLGAGSKAHLKSRFWPVLNKGGAVLYFEVVCTSTRVPTLAKYSTCCSRVLIV